MTRMRSKIARAGAALLASLLSECGNGSDPDKSANESGPPGNYRETHLDSTTIVDVPDTGISLG